MRDPKRIPRILSELQRIWEKYPELRLGQLLENAKYENNSEIKVDLFYLEDDDLVLRLKQFDGRIQDQKDSI